MKNAVRTHRERKIEKLIATPLTHKQAHQAFRVARLLGIDLAGNGPRGDYRVGPARWWDEALNAHPAADTPGACGFHLNQRATAHLDAKLRKIV